MHKNKKGANNRAVKKLHNFLAAIYTMCKKV